MNSVVGIVITLIILNMVFVLLGGRALDGNSGRADLPFRWLLGLSIFLVIFAVIDIPLEKIGVSFRTLQYTATFIYIIVIVYSVVYRLKKGKICSFEIKKIDRTVLIMTVLIGLQIAYGMHNGVYSSVSDASFYNGHVMNAIYTNTMFEHNVYTGQFEVTTKITDCMPMLMAVLSQIFHMHPLIMINRVIAIVEIVGFNLIVYEIAICLSNDNKIIAVETVGFATFMNLYTWRSGGEEVLWARLAESKSMLANIYIPLILLGLILIVKESDNRYNWIILSMFGMTGAALSASGTFIVPFMIGVGLFIVTTYQRKVKYVKYAVLSIVPCMLILIVRFIR